MQRRQPSSYSSSFSFGPGPLSPAIKALIIANVAIFILQTIAPRSAYGPDLLTATLGLRPDAVIPGLQVWQLATYMFLHGGVSHVLFNMLALWMFGTELERIWGTRYFLKYYFITGAGAAALTVLVALLPFGFSAALYRSVIIGASGSIYGLMLAYALYFPDRLILLLFFPVPARYAVMILGALAFYFSMADTGGVASATHLGGLIVGYIYLKGVRFHPLSELKYRYVKWKIGRVRKKFDVYSGGRSNSDWDRKIH